MTEIIWSARSEFFQRLCVNHLELESQVYIGALPIDSRPAVSQCCMCLKPQPVFPYQSCRQLHLPAGYQDHIFHTKPYGGDWTVSNLEYYDLPELQEDNAWISTPTGADPNPSHTIPPLTHDINGDPIETVFTNGIVLRYPYDYWPGWLCKDRELEGDWSFDHDQLLHFSQVWNPQKCEDSHLKQVTDEFSYVLESDTNAPTVPPIRQMTMRNVFYNAEIYFGLKRVFLDPDTYPGIPGYAPRWYHEVYNAVYGPRLDETANPVVPRTDTWGMTDISQWRIKPSEDVLRYWTRDGSTIPGKIQMGLPGNMQYTDHENVVHDISTQFVSVPQFGWDKHAGNYIKWVAADVDKYISSSDSTSWGENGSSHHKSLDHQEVVRDLIGYRLKRIEEISVTPQRLKYPGGAVIEGDPKDWVAGTPGVSKNIGTSDPNHTQSPQTGWYPAGSGTELSYVWPGSGLICDVVIEVEYEEVRYTDFIPPGGGPVAGSWPFNIGAYGTPGPHVDWAFTTGMTAPQWLALITDPSKVHHLDVGFPGPVTVNAHYIEHFDPVFGQPNAVPLDITWALLNNPGIIRSKGPFPADDKKIIWRKRAVDFKGMCGNELAQVTNLSHDISGQQEGGTPTSLCKVCMEPIPPDIEITKLASIQSYLSIGGAQINPDKYNEATNLAAVHSVHWFDSIVLTEGTEILSAIWSVARSSYTADAGVLFEVTVRAQDIDDAPDPNTVMDYDDYAWLGTPTVPVSVPADPPPQPVAIDVTAIIQAMVNRVGWVSGNAINLALEGAPLGVEETYRIDWASSTLVILAKP